LTFTVSFPFSLIFLSFSSIFSLFFSLGGGGHIYQNIDPWKNLGNLLKNICIYLSRKRRNKKSSGVAEKQKKLD
jgi:hypothetical protein